MSAVPAVVAYLQGLGLTVFDGEPPSQPPTHYVCVYSDDGTRSSDRFTAQPDRADEKVRTLSVGSTAEQCRWVRSKVKSLAGQRIGAGYVTHDFANPTGADDDVPGSLISGYDQFNVPVNVTG